MLHGRVCTFRRPRGRCARAGAARATPNVTVRRGRSHTCSTSAPLAAPALATLACPGEGVREGPHVARVCVCADLRGARHDDACFIFAPATRLVDLVLVLEVEIAETVDRGGDNVVIVARWPEGLAMEHFFTKILGPHAALRPVGPRRFDEGLECATKGAELFGRPLREQGAAGHQGGGAMGSRATDVRVCFWQPGDTQASDAVRRRRRCAHLHVEPCRGRQTLYNTRGLG